MSSIGFPLLLIPVAICNIIAFLMPELSLTTPLVSVPLMSATTWTITLSDVLLGLGILLLLLEVMKGARPGAKYFTDHLLSLLVFGGAAAEFLLLPRFGNSTFFLITLLALVDFLAGISLRVRRPRRYAAPAPVEAVAPAPVAPAPAPVAPVPAPVAPAPVAPVTPPVPEPVVAATQVAAPVIVTPVTPPAPTITAAPAVIVPPVRNDEPAAAAPAVIVPPVSPQVRSSDLETDHSKTPAPDKFPR